MPPGGGGGGGGYCSWWTQLKATVRRNITIKKRQKRRTASEIFMPIYIFTILAIVRAVQPETHYSAVSEPLGTAAVTNGSLVPPLALHVAPNDSQHAQFGAQLCRKLAAQGVPALLVMHVSEADLEAAALATPPTPIAGLVLPPAPGRDMAYTLRLDRRLPLPAESLAGAGQCRGGGEPVEAGARCAANMYLFSGFLMLQNTVDALMMQIRFNQTVDPTELTMQDGPKVAADAESSEFLKVFVPLYMVISLSQFITYQLTLIVGEKEEKIKDGLKQMGLRDSVYWTSWFLVYAVYVFVVASICMVIMYFTKLFPYSDNIYIYIIYILYGWSLVMLGFMLTPFFQKARVAGGVGNMAVTMMSLLFLLQVFIDTLPSGFFWLLSLLSPVAFTFGIERAVELDTKKIGLLSSNLWESDGGMPFGGCVIMIVFDIFLYAFLAFYLDNVIPNEFGRRESPFFIFKKSFWFGSNKAMLLGEDDEQYVTVDQEATNPDVEPVSQEVKKKLALRVFALRKEFKTDDETLVAVNDLSLDMYEGQITAILGHNGAGKTTFFDMLTGLIMPTSGTAIIYGLDITDSSDMRKLWGMIGICPQHDILLGDLSPREHLVFLAALRGIAPDRQRAAVNATLADIDLDVKADHPVHSLSGGQKRKLSVGQALIGDPRIVILDEPTAGVDPCSRRRMWRLLQRRKQGRLILLSTHFMDEADILADRKAIVSAGRLRCCGSSMFLKSRFGLGYHLTIVQGTDKSAEGVDAVLAAHVPEREKSRTHGNQLTFVLPMDSVSRFPGLFADLERQQEKLGVQSFGISFTSLEEVFLQLAEVDGRDQAAPELADVTRRVLEHGSGGGTATAAADDIELIPVSERWAAADGAPAPPSPPPVDVQPSAGRALRALLWVRLLNLVRVPAVLFFLVVLPVVLMVGGLLVNRGDSGSSTSEGNPVPLGSDTYPDLQQLLYLNNTGSSVDALLAGWNLSAVAYDGQFGALLDHPSALAGLTLAAADIVNAVVQDKAAHSPSVVLNAVNNGRLSQLQQSANQSAPVRLTLTSHPLPENNTQFQFNADIFTSSFMIGFLFLLVPCNIAVELVRERELKIRNALRVNGLSFTTYFMSFFIVMFFLFVALWVTMLVVIQAADVTTLSSGPAFTMLAALYLEYTVVGLLFASIVSYVFDKMETAMAVYPNMAMMGGMLPYMLVSLVDMLVDKGAGHVAEPMHYVFCVINPFYLPNGALYFLSKTFMMVHMLERREVEYSDYWSNPVFVMPLVLQLVQIPLLWLLLKFVDAKKNGHMTPAWCGSRLIRKDSAATEIAAAADDHQPDDDVLAEKRRVDAILSGNWTGPTPVIAVQALSKSYVTSKPTKDDTGVLRAVGDVSFAVDAGEVFGLLGPNGAGKTTTMRMIAAEESPTRGEVWVAGAPVTSSLSEAFQMVGYCPQFNALWRFITVQEHLRCFAQIRGVAPADVDRVVDYYIDGLQIHEHARKRAVRCSGGTRRKLSYALSMLGRPRAVLLDEPSTGMDPQSKRFLWDTIAAGFRGDRGAILTTHSMEEADALCTRLGIMVRGNLRCLGSTQHLKNKYGGGYVLEIKLTLDGDADEKMEKVEQMVRGLFPTAIVEESYGERIRYKIPQRDVVSLSEGFAELEAAKIPLGLEEYSLSQTTLEQVFLRFAMEQLLSLK